MLVGIRRVAAAQGVLSDLSVKVIDANFEPALEMRVGGRLDSIYALEIQDGAIHAIRAVRNPDKLAFIERQLSLV